LLAAGHFLADSRCTHDRQQLLKVATHLPFVLPGHCSTHSIKIEQHIVVSLLSAIATELAPLPKFTAVAPSLVTPPCP
jgi:hypothetical protein